MNMYKINMQLPASRVQELIWSRLLRHHSVVAQASLNIPLDILVVIRRTADSMDQSHNSVSMMMPGASPMLRLATSYEVS